MENSAPLFLNRQVGISNLNIILYKNDSLSTLILYLSFEVSNVYQQLDDI